MIYLIAALAIGLAFAAAALVMRRARHAARRQTLDQIAHTFGIEPMVKIGEQLGWITAVEETPTGVRVKIRR